MPYYLSAYVGSGTDLDPCRPRGATQPGWSAIDLRADGGATPAGNGLNRCLLHLPVHDPDPALIQIADQRGEQVPAGVRAVMAAALNATLNFSRLDDLIADLLLRPPGNAWRALRPFAGRYEIHLGGPLSPRPDFLAQALTFAESWNGIDSTGLTRDLTWTETFGTAWGITSNRARCAGNVGTNEARAEVDTASDSHMVQAELSLFTYVANALFMGLILRHPSDATASYYRAYSANTGHILQKKVLGTITDLTNDTSIPTGGVRVSATAVGSSISMTYGPSGLGPVTDMAITGYTRAGVTFYSDNAGNVGEFDDWSIQDVMPSLRNMNLSRFPIQKLANRLKGRSR